MDFQPVGRPEGKEGGRGRKEKEESKVKGGENKTSGLSI